MISNRLKVSHSIKQIESIIWYKKSLLKVSHGMNNLKISHGIKQFKVSYGIKQFEGITWYKQV